MIQSSDVGGTMCIAILSGVSGGSKKNLTRCSRITLSFYVTVKYTQKFIWIHLFERV